MGHGYRMSDNLNPAPMLAMMRMVNQAYRDGLRMALVVDAPASFKFLWRAARPLLNEKTRGKIRFVSREEAYELLVSLNGTEAAGVVDRMMRLNRGHEGCRGSKFPSELTDHDARHPGQGEPLLGCVPSRSLPLGRGVSVRNGGRNGH